MLVHGRCFEHLVHPVGVVFRIHDVLSCAGHVGLVLRRIHHLGRTAKALDGILEVVGDLSLAGLARLGGDEDDTVAAFCSVDGCRSAVLEHLHRRDVRRFERRDVIGAKTIDNVERVSLAVRRYTTHTNLYTFAWGTRR